MSYRSSFTLVELLIVIGILAILTAAVVIVLNPTEFLKQGRDSVRMTDVATIQKSIQQLQTQLELVSLGATSTVYISLPDTSATCANLGLPVLPAGYVYHCVSTASSTLTNGQGWIPIDFTQSTIQSLAKLPIDPINTSSTRTYYSYSTNGATYELSASLESTKYKAGGSNDAVSTDGGLSIGLLERGSNLSLLPIDYGDSSLVGYWTFDEGSGTSVYDKSGNGNIGIWQGTLGSQWTTGGRVAGAGQFNGVDNYVSVSGATLGQQNTAQEWTVSVWEKIGVKIDQRLLNFDIGEYLHFGSSNKLLLYLNSDVNDYYDYGLFNLQDNVWHHVVFVFKNNTGLREIYVDGIDVSTSGPNKTSLPAGIPTTWSIGGGSAFVSGILDDIRVYKRAFSRLEVLALYNSTK